MIWRRHVRAPQIEEVFLTDVCCEYWVCEEATKQRRKYPQQECFSWLQKLCSPYHMSQQGADLVFEPTLKRQKQQEKPNFKRNFLPKNRKREEITHTVNFTYVRLSKNNVTKIADFGLQFCFKEVVRDLQECTHYRRHHCLETILLLFKFCHPQNKRIFCLNSQLMSGWHINDNRWRNNEYRYSQGLPGNVLKIISRYQKYHYTLCLSLQKFAQVLFRVSLRAIVSPKRK